MNKPKETHPVRATLVRLPIPLYERLIRRAGELQIAQRREVSINSLIVEAVRQAVQ